MSLYHGNRKVPFPHGSGETPLRHPAEHYEGRARAGKRAGHHDFKTDEPRRRLYAGRQGAGVVRPAPRRAGRRRAQSVCRQPRADAVEIDRRLTALSFRYAGSGRLDRRGGRSFL